MALTRGFTGQKSIGRIKAGFGLTPGKGQAITHPFEASLGGGVGVCAGQTHAGLKDWKSMNIT
jgi:hypothetical protein